jgi:serine/threonine protein kinase
VHCAGAAGSYALKCLQLRHARNPTKIERTRREALTLLELRHPNVVQVHATGVREDGLIWMVMELLIGHTLAQVKARLGKVPLPWALRIGTQACAGLAAVHPHAVHRDIKPENIHLGADAVVRLLDLGAGKFHDHGLLTTGGSTLGTVPYMSPEQVLPNTSVDARADLFALGIVLAELISGVHPFAPGGLASENVFRLVRKIVGDTPVSLKGLAPWVPDHVGLVIDRALDRDRDRRWGSAAELGAALTAALDRHEHEVGPGEPLSTLVRDLHDEGDAARTVSPLASMEGAASPTVPSDEADTLVLDRARQVTGRTPTP